MARSVVAYQPWKRKTRRQEVARQLPGVSLGSPIQFTVVRFQYFCDCFSGQWYVRSEANSASPIRLPRSAFVKADL